MHNPVSVVVADLPAGGPGAGAAATLPRCLDSLRATIGARDEIVLVVPGPTAGQRDRRGLHGLTLVEVAADADLAACREAGRRAARHEVVVLLDADTVLPSHWLDPLVAALADPTVAAAGPRSNSVPGPQQVLGCAYDPSRRAAIVEFAKRWRREHRGQVADVAELAGLCVATRRTPRQGRQVVVHEAFVHHDAGPSCQLPPAPSDGPLLTASLIVKDEEELLGACLASLQGLCDEVVVYDTGSSDRTREIARAAGAVVVEGYWDDSFGAARNRCLEHCTGEWVLYVDADEVVCADVDAVRAALRASASEAHSVVLENVLGLGAGTRDEYLLGRVFRRALGHFEGRLHEQVVHRALGRGLVFDPLPGVRLVHYGYAADRLADRGKRERNLRLAEAALADARRGSADYGLALANLARSQTLAHRDAEAVETFEQAAQVLRGPRTVRNLGRSAVEAATRAGRFAQAWAWVERVRAAGEQPERVEVLAVLVLAAEGRDEEALARLLALPEQVVGEGGALFRRSELAALEAQLLVNAGRQGEAADRLLAALGRGVRDVPLARQVEVLRLAGRPLADLVAALPPQLDAATVAEALQLSSDVADELLDALWERSPGDVYVLAGAAVAAPHLSVERADAWSARLREGGLADRCPLLAIATAAQRGARDRLLAAGLALDGHGDERALAPLTAAAADVADADADAVLEELREAAPGAALLFDVVPADAVAASR